MPNSRPTVLQTTWNWRAPAGGRRRPTTHLRRTAIVQALVMSALAILLQVVLGHVWAGRILSVLAVAILLLGFFLPAAYAAVHRFGQRVGHAVGTVLTHLLLVPFFFLFFWPAAGWLRLRGRDPLHRRFRDPQWTYWISRQRHARDHNIERQFLLEDRAARSALREVGSLPRRTPENGS